MNVLYLTGAVPAGDQSTIGQLTQVAPQIQVTTVASANEALQAIRASGGFHTLITSPSLAHNETLALITSLRRDRVPIAIVPVVSEAHQDFFASAVSSGADDVLMMRGDTLNRVSETMTRIRQSPYLFPAENRRHLRVLYAGRDQVVWALLEQIPFVKAERATCASDGGCPVRNPGADDGSLRCDVVVVDEHPGDAHPLQVIKAVKAQASDLPVVVLTSSTGAEVAIAALDLGADDTVTKTGIYRRRLIATLRRVHQRIELTAQHEEVRAREVRLRQIVETVPHGIAVISGDGTVLAMNAAALAVVGAARPKDAVGRNLRTFVAAAGRDEVTQLLRRVSMGDSATVDFEVEAVDKQTRTARLKGVPLDRDARGRRGVIATLQVPGPGSADAADAYQVQSELRQVKIALRETGQRHADLEKQLAAERDSWTAARRQIEERAALDRETAAHARAEIETALEASRNELTQLHAAANAERAEFEASRADLHLRRHEEQQVAERTRLELEAALEAARAETRRLQDAMQAEQARWETSRAELDLRLRSVGDVHAADQGRWNADRQALADARDELHRAIELHAQERAKWETTAVDLRSRIADLDAAVTHHADAERTHDAVRAELQGAIDEARRELRLAADAYGAERTSWTEAREHLEAELGRANDARRQDEERWSGERAALEAARAALQQTFDSLSEDRARADEARQALEGRVAELQQAIDAAAGDRRQWEEARHALESRLGELQQALDASAGDRTRADEARQMLEARIVGLQAEVADREILRAALDTARHDLQQSIARLTAEQTGWDEARAELEGRVRELQIRGSELQEIEAALESTRAELERAIGAQDLERSVWQAERRELDERIARAQATYDEQQRLWDATREVLDQEVTLYRAREEQERGELDRLRKAEVIHEQQLQEAGERLEHATAAGAREQARLIEELATSAARLERLQNSDLFGYSLMTLDGHLIRCNDVFARMLGYVDAEDALVHTSGEPLAAMVGREDIDARLSTNGRTQAVETCLIRTDGQTTRVLESAVVVTGTPGEDAVVERILLDLGSQADLEDQLRHARRLEEVGNVATAMAPDIEELLRSVAESATRLSIDLEHAHPHRAEAETIVAGATRATELLRQLLAFSRKQGRAPEPVDLNDAVKRAEPTLSRLVGAHIDFQIHLGQADVIAAAEDDLEQLLTTLVVSARDLLPIGGTLRIETGGDPLRLSDAAGDEDISGAHQMLAVVAAGYGLQAAQPSAAIDQVARRCGGTITISGEPGRRAVLQVRFPRCSTSPGSNW